MQYGCYAQVAKEELEKIPEIDLILGVDEKKNIAEYIENNLQFKIKQKIDEINSQNAQIEVSDVSQQHEFVDFGLITHTEKTRAVIKVQDGCNQFCSYCIIPYARGRIRSRKPQSVLSEIQEIAKNGIKEVVITGIHVASYGNDFISEDIAEINQFMQANSGSDFKKNNAQYKLIDLLEAIEQIPEIKRIRLGSLEPTLITEEFVQRLGKLSKICDQFHLSLQSGCNETLKRMNRKYTVEQFEKATKLLRENFPNVHLTTDIIVGFPNETEQEFNQTYEFLKNIKFYKMHIFKYSPRKGTIAANMPNQIDGNIKEQRSNKLIELSNQNEEEYQQQYIGKEIEVLLEEREGKYLKGHTTNYMIAKCQTEENLENTIQKIRVTNTNNLELEGNRI